MLNIGHKDLTMIYSKCIVDDGGKIAYVSEILKDNSFKMLSSEGAYEKKYSSYEDLPTSPRLPYYINSDTEYSFSIVRRQYRRFKQGVYSENTIFSRIQYDSIPRVDIIDLNLEKILKKSKYFSKHEAIDCLRNGKKQSVAIDEQVCLTANNSVLFKGLIVGRWTAEGAIMVDPSYRHITRYNKCLQ